MVEYSIVIPCYNRKDNVLKTLYCLSKQTVVDRFEVVLVDDSSKDGTREAVLAGSYPFSFNYVRLEKQEDKWGASLPRNTGAKETNKESKAIIFLDSDILLPPHVIHTFIEDFESNPLKDRIIIGPYRFGYHVIDPHVEGWHTVIQPDEYPEDVRIKSFEGRDQSVLSSSMGDALACFGGLLFVPREWFFLSGGFEEDLFAGVEDGSFGLTLWEMKSKFSYDIRLMGWHNPHIITASRTDNIKRNLEILDARHKMDIVKATGEVQRVWGHDWHVDPSWLIAGGYDPKKLL